MCYGVSLLKPIVFPVPKPITTVLRADFMTSNQYVPDDARKWIVPPIPLGFKRDRIHVVQDQQPNILQFETIDRELPIGWSQAGVTRVKAFHTYGFHKGSMESASIRMAHTIAMQGIREIGSSASRFMGDVSGGLESAIGVIAGSTLNLAGASIGAGLNFLAETWPITEHVFDVEVWGDGTSTRKALEDFARAIIQTRLERLVIAISNITKDGVDIISLAVASLPAALQNVIKGSMTALKGIYNAAQATGAFLPGGGGLSQLLPQVPEIPAKLISLLTPGIDTTITHEITGKFVHIRHTVHVGPIASLLTGLTESQNGIGLVSSDLVFPPGDNTGGLLAQGLTPFGPSYDNTSRGTFANVLQGTPYRYACEPPPLWYEAQQSEGVQAQQIEAVQAQQIIIESREGLPTQDEVLQGVPVPPAGQQLPGPDGNLQPIDSPPVPSNPAEQGITSNPPELPPPPEMGIGR